MPAPARTQPAGDGSVVLYGSAAATRDAVSKLRGAGLLGGDNERDWRLYLPPELKSDDERKGFVVRPLPVPVGPGPCGKVLSGFEIRAKPDVFERYVDGITPRSAPDDIKLYLEIPGVSPQTPIDPQLGLGANVSAVLGNAGVQSVTRPCPPPR
jgi:hypothetical protein